MVESQLLVGPIPTGFREAPLQQRPVGQKELQPAGQRVAEQTGDQCPGLFEDFSGLARIGDRSAGAVRTEVAAVRQGGPAGGQTAGKAAGERGAFVAVKEFAVRGEQLAIGSDQFAAADPADGQRLFQAIPGAESPIAGSQIFRSAAAVADAAAGAGSGKTGFGTISFAVRGQVTSPDGGSADGAFRRDGIGRRRGNVGQTEQPPDQKRDAQGEVHSARIASISASSFGANVVFFCA